MHHRFIIPLFIILYFISGGCVERYYPEEDNLKTGTLVINAHLTDHIGIQEIEISRSSSLINSVYDPESGCYVELERENGDTRVFNEFQPGSYRCDLQPDFLETGFSYRLHVMTPDGNEYEDLYGGNNSLVLRKEWVGSFKLGDRLFKKLKGPGACTFK